MATKLTLCIVLLDVSEADEPDSAVINTTGEELARARPIRNVRPAPVDSFRPGSALARLDGWFRRAAS